MNIERTDKRQKVYVDMGTLRAQAMLPETLPMCPVSTSGDAYHCQPNYISPRGLVRIVEHYDRQLERRYLGKYYGRTHLVNDWDAEPPNPDDAEAAEKKRAQEAMSIAASLLVKSMNVRLLRNVALNSSLKDYARMAAIDELGEIATGEAADELIEMIDYRWWTYMRLDEGLRKAIIRALGRMKDARAFEHIAARLRRDPSPAVRCAAAAALGELGDERSVALLHEALNRDDDALRYHAAKALGCFPSVSNAHVLLEMLDDKDRQVRYEALAALTRMAPYIDDPHTTIERLMATHAVASEPPPWDRQAHIIRALTADVLGAFRHDAAVEPLARLLEDRDDYVVMFAAKGLAGTATPAARAVLDAFLDRVVRKKVTSYHMTEAVRVAARVLSEHGATSRLLAMLGDSRGSVHVIIREVLKTSNAARAVDANVQMTGDADTCAGMAGASERSRLPL